MPVIVSGGQKIKLSPSRHSKFICDIVEEFDAHFVPGARLVYASGDSENSGYFDQPFLSSLGVTIDNQRKLPDVIIYHPGNNWLILVEVAASHGIIDTKKHRKLSELFKGSRAGLIFVTAFPNRQALEEYSGTISWESDVWIADSPNHLIHFNGGRLLGPYPARSSVPPIHHPI